MAHADEFDSVAQMLFGIGVTAQRSLTSSDPDALIEALREIGNTAADASRELRRSVDAAGLEARLQARLPRSARLVRKGTPRTLPEADDALIIDTVLGAVRETGCRFALAYLEYADTHVRVRVQREGLAIVRLDVPVSG